MKREYINEIRRILYPDHIKCIVCGKEIHPNRYGLCDECSFELNENYCLRCGRHKVGIGDYCDECSDMTLYFDEARSSVVYDGNAKTVVRRLKYGDAKYLSSTLAEYLLDTLIKSEWDIDCFTFVPMDEKRLKKRGYNQSRLLAEEIAERTTTPCYELLKKIRPTPNQAKLSKSERLENLKGAFEYVTNCPKHVVLIDDVFTTGATSNECAKMLKKSGASVVYVLTFGSVAEQPTVDRPVQNISEFRR